MIGLFSHLDHGLRYCFTMYPHSQYDKPLTDTAIRISLLVALDSLLLLCLGRFRLSFLPRCFFNRFLALLPGLFSDHHDDGVYSAPSFASRSSWR
jgi:hypothetical protein